MTISHIGITVRNLARSVEFYAAALKPIGSAYPYLIPSRNPLTFLVTQPPPPSPHTCTVSPTLPASEISGSPVLPMGAPRNR